MGVLLQPAGQDLYFLRLSHRQQDALVRVLVGLGLQLPADQTAAVIIAAAVVGVEHDLLPAAGQHLLDQIAVVIVDMTRLPLLFGADQLRCPVIALVCVLVALILLLAADQLPVLRVAGIIVLVALFLLGASQLPGDLIAGLRVGMALRLLLRADQVPAEALVANLRVSVAQLLFLLAEQRPLFRIASGGVGVDFDLRQRADQTAVLAVTIRVMRM